MMGSRYYMLICAAALVLLCGCEAKTRYQVLSFFFDGVPPPEDRIVNGDTGAVMKKPEQQQKPSKHGPFAARMCNACHDSNTNALLLPRDKICLKCHVLETARRQHGPVASGGCLVCHDPHRSSSEYLLVSSVKGFCTYCHDPKEIYEREVHRDNTASCTDCHNPHGSDNDFFLR